MILVRKLTHISAIALAACVTLTLLGYVAKALIPFLTVSLITLLITWSVLATRSRKF